MTVVNFLIGLIGLGIVVFVHELGHLLAAKAVGIEVEAFSLGWGKKLFGFTRGGTEYRISVFPVGGYCKMKGERSYTEALDQKLNAIPKEEGSFFGAAPWRRIIALIAGPLANVIFAVIVLSVVWGFGFEFSDAPPRIVLASEYQELDEPTPADLAGLQTGDVIRRLGVRPITTFSDITHVATFNPRRTIPVAIERDGQLMTTSITPALDLENTRGYLGVLDWLDPVVLAVTPDSPADVSGLEAGDRILSVNDQPVRQFEDLVMLLDGSTGAVQIALERSGNRQTLTVEPREEGRTIGVSIGRPVWQTPDYGLLGAFGRGAAESFFVVLDTVLGFRLLGMGVNVFDAVSGPIEISATIGQVASSASRAGFWVGVRLFFTVLSSLSVVLAIMNLLPIPILDGGQILLAGLEWIRKRAPRPKSVYRYQMVGSVLVMAILLFAVFGDILFVAGR